MQPDTIGGRYRIHRIIGRGGMGSVFLADDETLGREVAVKQVGLLPGETVPDSARAMREARSTAALSHRNVVTVYDVIEEDGSIWLVMEHVPSRSLAQILSDTGPLEPTEVARIGAQVAAGLAAAHAAGIVHRDVKPGNVLVRSDGVAKLSDFGIARPDGDPALTQTNLFVGTPTYLSPEAARGETPTPASDVWSLGATLYAAVEGRPPYESSSNHLAVLNRIIEQDPAPPTQAGVLAPVLSRMLDRDPGSRWSMADAAHALDRIAAQGSPSTLAATRSEEEERAARDHRAAAAAAAGGAAAGAGAATANQHDTAAAPSPTHGSPTHGSPASGPTAPSPSEDRDRTRRLGPVLVGLLALVLAVGAALLFLDLDGSPDTPAGQDTPTDSASEKPDDEQATRSEEPEPSPEPSSPPPADEGAEAFIQRYFQTVPEDTDTGWSMLGPEGRSVGRDSYEGWWSSVEDVQVSDIEPAASGETADVTLTYTMKDGRVETERQRLDLLRSEDGWLINGDENI
ncbi:MAG TPA: serine/threonine-protein kinase [Nocardioides sp.]|nr:serine/threonine-protein kinase [Nocardioides sp.]